jgi:hypothetical protein
MAEKETSKKPESCYVSAFQTIASSVPLEKGYCLYSEEQFILGENQGVLQDLSTGGTPIS